MAGQRFTYEIVGELKLKSNDFQQEIRRLKQQINDLGKQRQQIQAEASARQAPLIAARNQERATQRNPLYAGVGGIQAEAGARAATLQKQIDAERKRTKRAVERVAAQEEATANDLGKTAAAKRSIETEILNLKEREKAVQQRLTGQLEAASQSAIDNAASRKQILGNPGLRSDLTSASVDADIISATKQRAKNEFLLTEEGQKALRLQEESNAVQSQVNALRKKIASEVRQEAGLGIPRGGGTVTQNLQQRLQSRNGEVSKAATEYATLGQLAQGALLTTGKFALAGSIFFGITTAIHSSFEEASKLETQFALLENQLQALGREGDFDTITEGLFKISRNTGIATSDLAALAVQLRGAFSGKSAEFINAQVDAAAKIERITGLSTAETTDSLTAISKTFGVSFKTIGDTAVGLQQRFGVLSKEIITFSADLAPVAAQAGLSFEKLAALGAGVQQLSGRSGAGLAESLGRVLSGLQDNAADILTVYQTNGKLLAHQSEVADNLAKGKTGAVLERLIQDYGKLSKAQQNLINSALGGSRQAPVLAALFGGDTISKELDRINSGATNAGKLEQQFKRLQGTIGQVLAQVRQVLLQIGVGIAESGILDAIKLVIQGFETVIELLRPIASIIKEANDAFGGLATKLLAVYAAMKLIKGLGGFRAAVASEGIGAAIGGIGRRTAAQAAGESIAAPVAGAGIARFLPKTTLGGLALGAVASGLLVEALSSGFSDGIDEAKKKAGEQAKKDFLKKKGLELAAVSTPDFTTEIHGFPEAAHNIKQFVTGGKSKEAELTDRRQEIQGAGLIALFREIQKQEGTKLKVPYTKSNIDYKASLSDAATVTTDDDLFAGLLALRDRLIDQYGKKYINGIIKDLQNKLGRKGKKSKFDTRAALKSGDQQDTEQALSNRRSDYDSGLIDEQQLRNSYSTATNALKTLVETGSASSQVRAEYFKVRGESNKFESDLIQRDLDDARQFRQYTGQETSEQNISEAVAALRDNKLTDRGVRADLIGQIFADYQHILQTKIDGVTEAADKLAISQRGVDIDPEVRIELARDRVAKILERSKASSKALRTIANATGQSVDDLRTQINAVAVYLGTTVAEATSIFIAAEIRVLAGTLEGYGTALAYAGKVSASAKNAIQGVKDQIGSLFDALVSIANDPALQVNPLEGIPGAVTGTADQNAGYAAQAGKDAASDAKAVLDARFSYLKALVEGDPVATAELDLQQANAELAAAENEADRWNALAHQVTAQHALDDALKAILEARFEFFKQLVANDPVAAAEYDIKKAYFDLLNAKSEADRQAAATQLTAANQQLKQTMFDIVSSISDVTQAMANFAGDAVGAAAEALKQLQAQLAFQRANGFGEAAINQTQASIINATAALRDSQLQEKENTIDFNLQVEKISTAQAIAQYEALLSQADILQLTTQQRRDLILKIQSLKKTLSQDLQFDLPSDLRLPTLYEARRLSQSGGNYQDNRVVTLTLNSTDPQSTEAAVAQITDALNAPPNYGSGSRIY